MDHRFAELTAAAEAVSATRFDVLISKPSLLNALHWERKRTTGHNRKKKHFQINKHTQRPEARSEFRVSASVSRSCKSPRTWEYNKKRSWLDVGDVFLLNDGCALEGLSIACQTWDWAMIFAVGETLGCEELFCEWLQDVVANNNLLFEECVLYPLTEGNDKLQSCDGSTRMWPRIVQLRPNVRNHPCFYMIQ